MTDDDTDSDTADAEEDPIQMIYDIIEQYYEGLKREDEGMGVG